MKARAPVPAHAAQVLAQRAAQLRSFLTPSESLLWSALSAGKLGVCFRRQVSIGRFIVDFCAPAARLVVEVDGPYHAHRQRADERRDRKLRRLGYRVLRLESSLVLGDLAGAVRQVQVALEQAPPS
jgi:adenine-specific DNA-methyltransferase